MFSLSSLGELDWEPKADSGPLSDLDSFLSGSGGGDATSINGGVMSPDDLLGVTAMKSEMPSSPLDAISPAMLSSLSPMDEMSPLVAVSPLTLQSSPLTLQSSLEGGSKLQLSPTYSSSSSSSSSSSDSWDSGVSAGEASPPDAHQQVS